MEETGRAYAHFAAKRGTLKPNAEETEEAPAGAYCAHCGGLVPGKGMAEGGEAGADETKDGDEESFESKKQGFLLALRKGK